MRLIGSVKRSETPMWQRTALDALDQRQGLLEAKADLVKAKRDELVGSHRVKAAIGQLTASSLGPSVDLCEAEPHDEDARHRWFDQHGR